MIELYDYNIIIINKKSFAIAVLNVNKFFFVIYVAIWKW